MARRWKAFDVETLNAEFRAIPVSDVDSLFAAMKAYRLEREGGYIVKSYGEGLMMIKSANRSQGRCLFFSTAQADGVEVLTALLAYKKESQEVPARVLETARARMKRAKE